jgi:hypothetical protein
MRELILQYGNSLLEGGIFGMVLSCLRTELGNRRTHILYLSLQLTDGFCESLPLSRGIGRCGLRLRDSKESRAG